LNLHFLHYAKVHINGKLVMSFNRFNQSIIDRLHNLGVHLLLYPKDL
jgi:hypothetical protein